MAQNMVVLMYTFSIYIYILIYSRVWQAPTGPVFRFCLSGQLPTRFSLGWIYLFAKVNRFACLLEIISLNETQLFYLHAQDKLTYWSQFTPTVWVIAIEVFGILQLTTIHIVDTLFFFWSNCNWHHFTPNYFNLIYSTVSLSRKHFFCLCYVDTLSPFCSNCNQHHLTPNCSNLIYSTVSLSRQHFFYFLLCQLVLNETSPAGENGGKYPSLAVLQLESPLAHLFTSCKW